MSKLIYDLIVTEYSKNLTCLLGCMEKAKKHAESNNYSADKFLDLKLAPDMLNFTKQVQIATDNAKGAAARLAQVNNPVFPDTEKTWIELEERVRATIKFLSEFSPAQFDGYQKAEATFPWNPGHALSGHDYLVTFAVPNFYFHLTTAYALLRAAGVNVGKSDFLGNLNWHPVA